MQKEKNQNKGKGGRPRKMANEIKRFRVAIYLDETQLNALRKQADEAGMKTSECARCLILDGKVVQRLSPIQIEYIRQLAGMANNLNQLAKAAHISDFRYITEECTNTCLKIDELLNKIKQ